MNLRIRRSRSRRNVSRGSCPGRRNRKFAAINVRIRGTSSVGSARQERAPAAAPNGNGSSSLDEVVVVGYGTTRRKDLRYNENPSTGTFTALKADIRLATAR